MDITGIPKFFIRGVIAPPDPMMSLFGGEETSTSANDVREFINANSEAKELVFEISSLGGYVTEGFEMFDIIKNSGKKIITIGYSVNSIAVMPFLAGNKRYISENASFRIHNSRIDPFDLGGGYLTAEDLNALAREAEQTDERILNAYCKVLGEEKRSELFALMAADKDLDSKKVIKLGFAHGYYSTQPATKAKNVLINCIDPYWNDKKETYNKILQNKINMENEKVKELEGKVGFIEKLLKNFKKLVIKNEVSLELEDGTLLSASGDGDLVGQTVLIVVDGMPTEPAPDGTHKLKDGRSIVVAGGVVTEVIESENVNSLKEEIANLKAALESKDAEIANKTEQLNKLTADTTQQLNSLQDEFTKLKNMVPGDTETAKVIPINTPKAMNERERILQAQKNRVQKIYNR